MNAPPLVALLAAGRSSRFGADKLGQMLAGRALGAYAAEAALETGLPLICVTGEDRPDWLAPEIEAVPNSRAAEGLATSLALAARIALERGCPALLIHLADMPCLPGSHLVRLAESGAPAACRYTSGGPGVPALLPARLYPALIELAGDRGAGALLARLPDLTLIQTPPEYLLDVDTPAALAEAEARIASA